MKIKTKTITMPDKRKVVIRAEYNANMDWVTPYTEGPIEDLLKLIELDDIGTIPGTQFEGWFGRSLKEHDCTWIDTDDGGDWIEWIE